MYKLRDWINERDIKYYHNISSNERAVEYLEKHKHLIDNHNIFLNIHAIHIIEKRIQYDNWFNLVNYNKNAVNFLRNNPQYIRHDKLCGEEHGIEFVDELIKNDELEKINWSKLSGNLAAMHILNDPKYYDYLDWENIIKNKNAGELVKNNLHMVKQHWNVICKQPHLIDIIEQNMDKIYWGWLSSNYNAIHILEKNLNKILIENLCWNKNGFKLLLYFNHEFRNNIHYETNIVFEYFDYCEKHNKPFNLIKMLSKYGYTEKHMNFLRHNNNFGYLSENPNIFEYDYERMRKTRQALPWYNDIKKN